MYFFTYVGCFLLAVVIRVYGSHYTQQWVVHIDGGPEVADSVAKDHGFTNLGTVCFSFIFISS